MSDSEIYREALSHHKACYLCKWIVEDFKENKKLTDAPYDYNNKGDFPRDSKEKHAKLEKGVTV